MYDLMYEVRGAAMEVYNHFGPGLLESVYEDKLIVELKSVEEKKDVYYKQLRTYLKLLNKEEGLLINFGEYDLKKGMRRVTLNEYRIAKPPAKRNNLQDLQDFASAASRRKERT